MRLKWIRDDYYTTGPDSEHSGEYRVIKATGAVQTNADGISTVASFEVVGWASDSSPDALSAAIQTYEDNL